MLFFSKARLNCAVVACVCVWQIGLFQVHSAVAAPEQSTGGQGSTGKSIEDELNSLLSEIPLAPGDITLEDDPWNFSGFTELVFQYSTNDQLVGLERDWLKRETRTRLYWDYRGRFVNGVLSADIYAGRYLSRDGSSELIYKPESQARAELQEAYVSKIQNSTRWKLGKQLLHWGNGDVFHVTNYFDQLDMRQMYAIDEDDRYRGVPIFSAQYFIGDHSLQFVLAPVFAPPLLPDEDDFWAIDGPEQDILTQSFITENEYDDRVSAAFRFGGVWQNIDYHLSLFYGVSRDLIYTSTVDGEAIFLFGNTESTFTAGTAEYDVSSKMFYERVTTLGLELASTFERLAFRLELAYTPNMVAITGVKQADLETVVRTDGLVASDLDAGDTFNFSGSLNNINREPALGSVLGIDYNYRGANGFLLAEWLFIRYLKNNSLYVEPLLSNALLLRWQDRFYNEHIIVDVSFTTQPPEPGSGFVFSPNIGWDCKNGFTTELTYYRFKQDKTENDLAFELVENKDLVELGVKYEF